MPTLQNNEKGRRRVQHPGAGRISRIADITAWDRKESTNQKQPPLGMLRVKESRLFADMFARVQLAYDQAWCWSLHRLWLNRVLNVLRMQPGAPDLYANEAQRLISRMKREDCAGAFFIEADDLREIAHRLREYSRTLTALAAAEIDALRQCSERRCER